MARAFARAVVSVLWAGLLSLAAGSSVTAADRGAAMVPVRDGEGAQVGLYRESHALVIGISDYTGDWSKLPGVAEDIAAVKAALEDHGFQVEVIQDADQQTLEQGYREFISRYGLDKDNRLLFYFAGHGYTHKPAYAADDPAQWMGYIVSRDAPSPDSDFAGFRRNALSMLRFEELAKTIEARHALFVFDSCFSGSVFHAMRGAPPAITRKSSLPVRQFITAGGADQEVPDVSVFRRQFVALLGGEGDVTGDGYITGEELGLLLQQRVTDATGGAQTPLHGKLRDPHGRLNSGDFVFSLTPPTRLSAQLRYVYRAGGQGPLQPIEDGAILNSGDTYKVVFTPETDGYVYIFQVDGAGHLFPLFPMRQMGDVVVDNFNPVEGGRDYVLPAPDKAFVLDETVGTERLYFITSLAPNPDLEMLAESPPVDAARHLATRGVAGITADAPPAESAAARVDVQWDRSEQRFPVSQQQFGNLCDGCALVTEFEHR